MGHHPVTNAGARAITIAAITIAVIAIVTIFVPAIIPVPIPAIVMAVPAAGIIWIIPATIARVTAPCVPAPTAIPVWASITKADAHTRVPGIISPIWIVPITVVPEWVVKSAVIAHVIKTVVKAIDARAI